MWMTSSAYTIYFFLNVDYEFHNIIILPITGKK